MVCEKLLAVALRMAEGDIALASKHKGGVERKLSSLCTYAYDIG